MCVAEETNNCEAAQRFSVLIVNDIGGRLITEVALFLGFHGDCGPHVIHMHTL